MPLLRVLIDTNILISYLLPSKTPGAISALIDAAMNARFVPVLPVGVIEEFEETITTKPYLVNRISRSNMNQLVDSLARIGEVLPPFEQKLLLRTRDRKDDYILTAAILGQADYLVTGDRDLLTLGEVGQLKIVSPGELLELIS